MPSVSTSAMAKKRQGNLMTIQLIEQDVGMNLANNGFGLSF